MDEPSRHRRDTYARRALVPVLLLLFGGAFVALVLVSRSWVFPRKVVDLDFSAYWTAARMAFSEGGSPYDARALADRGADWLPLYSTVPPFIYTPVALLAFGGLEGLAFTTAARAMLVINLLALGATFIFVARTLRLGRSRLGIVYAAAYFLCFAPIYQGLGLGQVNAVLLLLLCGLWHAYRTGRSAWLGGVAGALAVFIKVHFGLLVLPLLLGRHWRLLFALAVSGAVGVVVSEAVFPFSAWGDWYALVIRGSSALGIPILQGLLSIAEPTNLGVPAMLARFFVGNPYFRTLPVPPELASALTLLVCGVLVGWTAWVLWRSSRMPRTPERADAELCLTLATIFEVSPISWDHHQVFMLPALLLLGRSLLTPGASSLPLVRGALGAAFFTMALHPAFLGLRDATSVMAVATLRSLVLLGVWACMSAWVLRSGRSPEGDSARLELPADAGASAPAA